MKTGDDSIVIFFSSRRRHTRYWRDWSSDVCSSDLAAEVGELYEEGDASYGASSVLDELAHGAGGAPGGEQVVGDQDASAGVYGVCVGLEGVCAVLEVVGGGDGLSRELVRFTGEDQAFAGAVGQSRAEDEAAGFGGEDAVVFP